MTTTVLHIPYTYFPDPLGGTEVYVSDLISELATLGIESSVAAPTPAGFRGGAPLSYRVHGVQVTRLPVAGTSHDIEYVYGRGDEATRYALLELVRRDRPDIVHFHSYTPAVNGELSRAVRACGPKVVITYHTPTVSCVRGNLLRFGRIPCDGTMIVNRCSACVLQQNGVPRPAADALGRIPPSLGEAIRKVGGNGGVWTALRMTELMRLRHTDALSFLRTADRVIAVTTWVRDLLLRNGVPEAKIVFSRQGIAGARTAIPPVTKRASPPGRHTRAVMLGRLDPTKGFDIPLKALARLPELRLTIDIFGTSDTDNAYVRELSAMSANDHRVTLHAPLPVDDVIPRLADFDVLLVPSQWLESGPLVVLEAQAAGLPVVGTALGGIAERVRHDHDGMLVEPFSIAAWVQALRRLVEHPADLHRWRTAVRPPRTMREVATDMAGVYTSLSGPTAA